MAAELVPELAQPVLPFLLVGAEGVGEVAHVFRLEHWDVGAWLRLRLALALGGLPSVVHACGNGRIVA